MSEQSPVTSGPHVGIGSSLPVLVKTVWLVMKKRDVQNFGRILEFLELTHEQVPGLLCYMHHAKLSTGLRGRIVLHMIEEKKPLLDILTTLNCHFPPVLLDDSAAAQRKVFKVQQCKIHFRRLVLRMIRDEKFRRNYIENTLHLEYGDTFMAVLEKLLWEFLCRLETILNHKVPQHIEPPVIHEDHLSSTPIRPSSGLNFSDIPGVSNTKEMSMLKRKRPSPTTDNVTSTEENQCSVRNKKGHCRGEGIASQAEGLVQQPASRRMPNLVNSSYDGGKRVNESSPSYFPIFGFDCSESSKVMHCENHSPPDPLQSQGLDLDLEHALDPHTRNEVMGHGSLTDIEDPDVAQTLDHSPISNHEQRYTHDVSGGNCEGQGKALSQGLRRSWRYQPRVILTKLPLNIMNMYLDQEIAQDETPEEDLIPQVADSEVFQSETFPDSGSWFWVHSGPTDNDSNDSDYFPGRSIFHHVGAESNPKRGLRFSSLP